VSAAYSTIFGEQLVSLNENRKKRKRLRFLRFSFTQRTQRKRLRLNGNRALWNEHAFMCSGRATKTHHDDDDDDNNNYVLVFLSASHGEQLDTLQSKNLST